MKQVLHKLAVIACAWPLISVKAHGLDLKWDASFTRDQQVLGRQALARIASRWQSLSFETLPATPVKIEVLGRPQASRHGARSQPGVIQLSALLSPKDFSSVIAHEFAHQVWLNHCGLTSPQDEIIHEALALWISEDLHRLVLNDQQTPYLSQAREALFQQKGQPLTSDPKPVQVALSRLLATPDTQKTWQQFFQKLVPQCRTTENFREQFWNLVAQTDYAPRVGRLHFLLQDGLSHEVLSSHGPVQNSYPVGSLLKPLAIQLLPSLQTPLNSRPDPTWYCPSMNVRSRTWNWQEALTKSCNGFFLDHLIGASEWQNWRHFWTHWGRPQVGLAMTEVIGLNAHFKMSLEQVLQIYQWLDLTSPTIIDALRETAHSGTMASGADAEWFERNQIALKTGSVRSTSGEPIYSWIVALGPRTGEGASAFRAVIFSEGRATSELLPELRALLVKRWWQKSKPAQVQVLGLVPLNKLKFSCPAGSPALYRPMPGQWKLSAAGDSPMNLPVNHELQCLGGPVRLHFPGRKGEDLSRLYYGRLRVESEDKLLAESKVDLASADSLPADGRQLRARRGSAVTLITSEGHYAEQVLASEFPRGHQETLKALALGVLHNHSHSPHSARPVCDTTHCQVFAFQEGVPAHLRARIRSAVEVALHQRGDFKFAEPWFYFSLGGSKPWSKKVSNDLIKQQLALTSSAAELIREPSGQIQVLSQSGERRLLDCESLRNQLRLLSCPDNIHRAGSEWTFSGRGEGHGRGLNLIDADLKSLAGAKFDSLLKEKVNENSSHY